MKEFSGILKEAKLDYTRMPPKLKSNALSLVILFLLISCSNNEKNQSNLPNLKFIRDHSIGIDEQTSAHISNFQYYQDAKTEREYLCILNKPTNGINIYPLDNNDQVTKIKLEKEGPFGLGSISGFYVVNFDSIYVMNPGTLRLYHTNSKGAILKQFSLRSPNINVGYILPNTDDSMEIRFKEDTIFIPGFPAIFYDKKQQQYFDQGKNMIRLVLGSGKIDNLIPFPNKDILFDKNYTSQVVGIMAISSFDGTSNVVSFRADPTIYVYDSDGNLRTKHLIKSRYITDPIKGIDKGQFLGDTMEEFLYYLNNTFYDRIIYDRHRRLYYRLIKHATSEPFTRKMLMTGKLIRHAYSMIVLNENFQILGELDIPMGLGKGMIIPIREGILIESSKNRNEDELKFELFKLVEK